MEHNESDSGIKFLSVTAEVPLQIILDSTVHNVSSGVISVKYLLEILLYDLKYFVQTASEISNKN